MLTLTDIYCYPIKSMGGIRLETANCLERGLEYDRRWMLIDQDNRFVSQREHAHMSLFKISIENDRFTLKYGNEQRSIPKGLKGDHYVDIQIWADTCKGIILEDEVNSWLSNILGFEVHLAFQANEDKRKVDPDFAKNEEITSLSDGYPYLALGQSSLDMLNEKLSDPIGINRFRANLVFSGGQPHEEDNWSSFKIGDASFYGAKPCSRCQVITINQETAEIGKEPTRTLARYRNFNHKIKFGMNVLCSGEGRIKVGDEIILS